MSVYPGDGLYVLDSEELDAVAGGWFGSHFFEKVAEATGLVAKKAEGVPGGQPVGFTLGLISLGAWGVSKL